jgi:hypothetical protein
MAHVASYDSSPTLTHNSEHEGGTFLRNVGNELPNHTAQEPKALATQQSLQIVKIHQV